MAEARRRWSWRSWLSDIGEAFSRFSLAVLLAGFLTIFKLWANNPSEAEPHGYPLIDNLNGTYKEPTSICR